jgi:TolB-like protein/DNA-binding winged helix-turn-helix (wHTH) protein/Flp pilus assembly protein TadD
VSIANSVSERYGLCRANSKQAWHLHRCSPRGVKSFHSPGCSAMASNVVGSQQAIRFGDDFELDLRIPRLRHGTRVLKLERIPLEILVLLVEHPGDVISREEIVAKVWGRDVFLDTDNSIRGAVRKIRQVLKDDPEQPQFIQTITGQGYRFIAPVIRPQETNKTVSIPEVGKADRLEIAVHSRDDQASGISHLGRWILGAIALVGILIVAAIVTWRRAPETTPKIQSLAVLPLKNLSGDSSQEYISDGITEELIGRLAAIHDLRVISRTSVMRFKETQPSIPEIAKALKVDAIVEGSVMREGNRIRVHAQLIRGATDAHLWSESYDRELEDVLTLESDVAQAIAGKVAVTITGQERSRLVAARHIAPEVYESYLKGEFALQKSNDRADLEETIGYFNQAIEKDPAFPGAYVGLANAYIALGTVFAGGPPAETRPKVIAAARKALELDPELAEAHVLLANVYQTEWRWSEAEAEYKWALQMRPNDAAAHLGFARWLLSEGRTEEAMEWSKRARELDPLAVSGTSLAWILFSARHYDEAITELHATLAVTPDNAMALWFLGFSFIGEGKPQDAIPPLERAASLTDGSPGVVGVLARAYGHAGRRSDALRLIDKLKKRRQKEYVPAAPFVQAYVGLGNYDEAFAWFERAYQEKSNILQWIKVEPFPDAMRSDPRFADLIHRVGLDQSP